MGIGVLLAQSHTVIGHALHGLATGLATGLALALGRFVDAGRGHLDLLIVEDVRITTLGLLGLGLLGLGLLGLGRLASLPRCLAVGLVDLRLGHDLDLDDAHALLVLADVGVVTEVALLRVVPAGPSGSAVASDAFLALEVAVHTPRELNLGRLVFPCKLVITADLSEDLADDHPSPHTLAPTEVGLCESLASNFAHLHLDVLEVRAEAAVATCRVRVIVLKRASGRARHIHMVG